MITKIVSGGQTGADAGALSAAKDLGLKTGGWMPQGFRTEDGPRPDMAQTYAMQEHSSSRYPPRTQSNVLLSDATLIFGNRHSPGSRLTANYAFAVGKPVWFHDWSAFSGEFAQLPTKAFEEWLRHYQIETLNVAGNRESQNPGIFYATKYFLIVNLEPLLASRNQKEQTHV